MIYTIFIHARTSYAEYYIVFLGSTYWKNLPANFGVYNLILCHNEGLDGAASKVWTSINSNMWREIRVMEYQPLVELHISVCTVMLLECICYLFIV